MSFKLTFGLTDQTFKKIFYFKVFSSIMSVYCPNISTRILPSHCSIQTIKQNISIFFYIMNSFSNIDTWTLDMIKLVNFLMFNVLFNVYILDQRWETVSIKSLFVWTWVTASTLYLQFLMVSETILKRHIRNFWWRYFLTFSIPSPGKWRQSIVTPAILIGTVNKLYTNLTSIIEWLYFPLSWHCDLPVPC